MSYARYAGLTTIRLYGVESNWAKSGLLEVYKKASASKLLFIVHPNNLRELSKYELITETQASEIQNELSAKGEALFSGKRADYTLRLRRGCERRRNRQEVDRKTLIGSAISGIYKN